MAVAVCMAVTVAVAVSVPAGQTDDRRRQDREQPRAVDEAALGCRAGGPIALPPDVGDLGLAVDGRDRHQVDHRALAARVRELDVGAVAQGVVWARVTQIRTGFTLSRPLTSQDPRLWRGHPLSRLRAAARRDDGVSLGSCRRRGYDVSQPIRMTS